MAQQARYHKLQLKWRAVSNSKVARYTVFQDNESGQKYKHMNKSKEYKEPLTIVLLYQISIKSITE